MLLIYVIQIRWLRTTFAEGVYFVWPCKTMVLLLKIVSNMVRVIGICRDCFWIHSIGIGLSPLFNREDPMGLTYSNPWVHLHKPSSLTYTSFVMHVSTWLDQCAVLLIIQGWETIVSDYDLWFNVTCSWVGLNMYFQLLIFTSPT